MVGAIFASVPLAFDLLAAIFSGISTIVAAAGFPSSVS